MMQENLRGRQEFDTIVQAQMVMQMAEMDHAICSSQATHKRKEFGIEV
jgi:hypothetical protein